MLKMTSPATTSTDNPWDGLRPQNVVQAAREDIDRRKRNEQRDRDGDWDFEPYAFLRKHVNNADGPFGLIQAALEAVVKDREHPKPIYSKEVVERGRTLTKWFDPSLRGLLNRSTKPHLKHLYSEALLRAALEMEKGS